MSYETNIRELFSNAEVRDRNANKARDERHSDYPCYLCDAPILRDKERLITITNGGGTMVPDGRFTDMNDGGFLGGHPVGPTCWRKVARLFLSTHGERLVDVQKRGPDHAEHCCSLHGCR